MDAVDANVDGLTMAVDGRDGTGVAIDKLRLRLQDVEQGRLLGLGEGLAEAEVNLNVAIAALTIVCDFCENQLVESHSLARLLGELLNLRHGRSVSPMLIRPKRSGAPSDHVLVETIKGQLAALVEHLQSQGSTRRAAAEWVVRHLPDRLRQALGDPKPRTVSDWLSRWSGMGGQVGPGRVGYEGMKTRFAARPIDLQAALRTFEEHLPPG